MTHFDYDSQREKTFLKIFRLDAFFNYIYIYILYIYIYMFIYIYIYLYSLRKSNNYSLKNAQYKSVIILWEEDDAK